MNIRKTFVLMIVALFVCSATAFAAGSLNVCEKCGKTGLGHVPLVTTAQTACAPFDFDGAPVDDCTGMITPDADSIPNLPTQAYGYCTGDNYDQRLVFQICNCSSVARFNSADAKISIRMTVLTTGVYWSAPNMPTVNPAELLHDPALNDPPVTATVGYNGSVPQPSAAAGLSLPEIRFQPYSSLTTACAPADPNLTRTFGGVRYYYLDANGARIVASPYGGTSCTLGTAARPTIVESYYGTAGQANTWDGYLIREADKTAQTSAWVIDVPPLRLDHNVAKNGDTVKIRVEMLDPGSAGICQACLPICSCDFDLGIIGCTAGGSCAFFPYVVTQAGAWQTGIAIANTDARTITNPTLTFTLTDNKGTVCKATLPFAAKVGAWMLDDPKLAFSPAPTAGAAMLKVEGNFNLDGYHFMTNSDFGAGTLPRTVCP